MKPTALTGRARWIARELMKKSPALPGALTNNELRDMLADAVKKGYAIAQREIAFIEANAGGDNPSEHADTVSSALTAFVANDDTGY